MRRLWNALSTFAVINLLAVLGFLGWLGFTDRLNLDRVDEMRSLLAVTITDEEAAAADEEAVTTALEAEALVEADRQNPPLPSDIQIQQVNLAQQQSDQAERRLKDETDQRIVELRLRADQLERRERDFIAQKDAWEASIAQDQDRRRDVQFQKTVRLYEAAAGKIAKDRLLVLVEQGAIEQAVRYIDAMNVRAASKTLKELKSESENELATDLLERLRTLGVQPGGTGTSNDDSAGST